MAQVRYRSYERLAGVDSVSSARDVRKGRLARVKNMWRDYRSGQGAALETSPGFRALTRFSGTVHGIYAQEVGGEVFFLVHAGGALYRVPRTLLDKPLSLASLVPIGLLADRDSTALSLGEEVYLLDGEGFYRVDGKGDLTCLSGDEENAYIPISYFNGERYEQRNLLTSRTKHVYTLTDPLLYEDCTQGLSYRVTDEEMGYAELYDAQGAFLLSSVTIPARVCIGSRYYAVTSVAAGAFNNFHRLGQVSLPDTLEHIGERAFFGCASLTSLSVPDGVQRIDSYAFAACTSLVRVYLGKGLTHISSHAFSATEALEEIRYGGSEGEYAAILREEPTGLAREGLSFRYFATALRMRSGVIRFPIYDEARQVLRVEIDGEALLPNGEGALVRQDVYEENRVTGVRISAEEIRSLAGSRVVITLGGVPVGIGASVEGSTLIGGCRLLSSFDGRLFLSGNPAVPDAVFYTALASDGSHDFSYVGELNYWHEGGSAISALLSAGRYLYVFKDDARSEGTILCHKRQESTSDMVPVIYPRVEELSGVGCVGSAICLPGDSVFLSRSGVWGIDRALLDSERSIGRRSVLLDAEFPSPLPTRGCFALYDGYLLLLLGDRLYLADTLQETTVNSQRGYEWYIWDGIGSYTGDSPLYRYTDTLPPFCGQNAFFCHPQPSLPVTGTVYSEEVNGERVYYVKDETDPLIRYAVDSDGERTGGTFSAASALLSYGEILLFGTCDGTLCAFATDKRGTSLYRERDCALYHLEGDEYRPCARAETLRRHASDEIERVPLYERIDGEYVPLGDMDVYRDEGRVVVCERVDSDDDRQGGIPRYYYTHQQHAYASGFALHADDCDAPSFAKETVPRSLLIRAKRFAGSRVDVLCRTDRRPWRRIETVTCGGECGYMDFSSHDFRTEESVLLVCRERERGWCEKQLQLYSDGFRSPFGVYGIAFRYRVSGTIRGG